MNTLKKLFTIFFINLFFLIFINGAYALTEGGLFDQNLSFWSDNEDVRALQVFLNKDPDTQVATSGSGSAGQETTAFNFLTRSAVVKFQSKYNLNITGYFDTQTREKVNEIILNTQKQQNNNENKEKVFNPETDSKIFYISSDPSLPGSNVNIIAYGLKVDENKKNISQVYFEKGLQKHQVSNLKIVNEGYATFNIPNVSGGQYNLFIDNKGVRSEPFVVHVQKRSGFHWTSPEYNPPKITSVSNQPIVYGDVVEIRGSNFSSDSVVISPLGEYPNGDNKIDVVNNSLIKLTFEKLDHLKDVDIGEAYFESFIKIKNKEGISQNFSVKFGDKKQGDLEKNIKNQNNNFETSSSDKSFFNGLKKSLISSGVGALAGKLSSFTSNLSVGGSGLGGASYNPFVYGGNLLSTLECPCSANILMYIYDYKSNSVLPLVYQPGASKLLAGSPTGFYQLGSYLPLGYCLMPCTSCCYEVPSKGTAGAGMPGYGTAGN